MPLWGRFGVAHTRVAQRGKPVVKAISRLPHSTGEASLKALDPRKGMPMCTRPGSGKKGTYPHPAPFPHPPIQLHLLQGSLGNSHFLRSSWRTGGTRLGFGSDAIGFSGESLGEIQQQTVSPVAERVGLDPLPCHLDFLHSGILPGRRGERFSVSRQPFEGQQDGQKTLDARASAFPQSPSCGGALPSEPPAAWGRIHGSLL